MKIIQCEQRSPEWFEARKNLITASRVGEFCANPKCVTLTIPEIIDQLVSFEIPHKKSSKRDELLALLPDLEVHKDFSPAVQTLIEELLGEEADCDDRPPDRGNFWTERGLRLEPDARAAYEKLINSKVIEVGLCVHDSGLFGCSPDGLVYDTFGISHGVEIKCPEGKTHLRYLRENKVPNDYANQVQASLATTGLNRWDFISFHPNLPPLHVVTYRSEFTEKLEQGLIQIGEEKRRQEKLLAKAYLEYFDPKSA